MPVIKKMFQRRQWMASVAVIMLMATVVVVIFQNCAEPLNLASEDSLSYQSSLPFAYDIEMDQLAFMSCTDMNGVYDEKAFFTFRMGAYGEGSGLRLTDDYLEQTKNFSEADRAAALGNSELNTAAALQLSIRFNNELDMMQTGGSSVPVEDSDFDNYLAPLDVPGIANALVSLEEEERLRIVPGISRLDNRTVDGSIRFLTNGTALDQIVGNLFSNNSKLVLSYVDGLGAYPSVSRGPDQKKAIHGFGYGLSFNQPRGLNTQFVSGPPRAITRVDEYDLLTGRQTTANWSCPAELQFIIVQPYDLPQGIVCGSGEIYTNQGCKPTIQCNNDPSCQPRASLATNECRLMPDMIPDAATNPARYARYKAVRNMLPVEYWYLDLDNNCVIPKEIGSCYGGPNYSVNYKGGTCEGADCPHVVSICLRQ